MFDEKAYSIKMDKALEVFTKELSSLRTGRANAAMLDLVKVDVYGQQMPINQVGSITTPEPRMINIQVWDLNNVSLVDAAIKKSDLGLNPQIEKRSKWRTKKTIKRKRNWRRSGKIIRKKCPNYYRWSYQSSWWKGFFKRKRNNDHIKWTH